MTLVQILTTIYGVLIVLVLIVLGFNIATFRILRRIKRDEIAAANEQMLMAYPERSHKVASVPVKGQGATIQFFTGRKPDEA